MADGPDDRAVQRRPDRVPPHNLEAEQAVLGSMLLSPDSVEGALSMLEDTDFYRPAHGRIFTAVSDLYARSVPVDHLSVADRLESTDQLEAAGGKAYLLDLSGAVPTTANWMRYAEIVKRLSMMRQLITAATQIVALGYDAPDDVGEVVEDAERLIFQVTNKRVSSNFRDITELLKISFEQLEELFDKGEHITGVETGFKELDKLTAGLHPGDLVILAARPSVGKTALALNLAVNAARKGSAVAIFSLEMSAEQLVQRVLCAEARINLQDVRTGYLKESDWHAVHTAMGKLANLDFYVDDTPSISILEVRAKARRQLRNKPKGLIVVDYLQLMQPQRSRSENRQVEIAEISRGLKILAKELGVPVVALSQLSRAVEQRAGKRPMLSDLRECVTGETLVVLADGSRVPISELVGTTPRVLAVNEGGAVVAAQSDKVWPVGVRSVSRVTLASGRTIRATMKHRFLTGRGWIRLSEMSAGEHVALSRELPEPTECVDWSESRLALLGHLVGDGSYLSGQPLRYTTASEENSEVVTQAAAEFGCRVSRHEGRGSWHQLVVAGNGNRWRPAGVNAWLRELGIYGQRSAEKSLPAEVFRLSNASLAILLRHLWATDGCIWVSASGPRRARVYFSTCSRTLAADVAHILMRLGIVARIRTTVSAGSSCVYSVDVSGAADQRRFLDRVGAFGPRVAPACELAALLGSIRPNTNVDTMPPEVFSAVKASMAERGVTQRAMAEARGTSYGGSSHFSFAPSRSVVLDYALILDDAALAEQATNDLFWDRIVSVEPDGEEMVYDLTVPGPASWLADGIVSHNSGAIEQDADIVMFLDRDTSPGAEDEEGRPAKGTAELIVAKHRNGPLGTVPLVFMERFTKFVDMTNRV